MIRLIINFIINSLIVFTAVVAGVEAHQLYTNGWDLWTAGRLFISAGFSGMLVLFVVSFVLAALQQQE